MQQPVEVSKSRGRDAIMGRMIANTMVLLVSLLAPGAGGAAPQGDRPKLIRTGRVQVDNSQHQALTS